MIFHNLWDLCAKLTTNLAYFWPKIKYSRVFTVIRAVVEQEHEGVDNTAFELLYTKFRAEQVSSDYNKSCQPLDPPPLE